MGRPSPQIDPRSSMPHHSPPGRRRLDPSRGGKKDVGRAREARRGRRVRHDRGSDAVSVRRPHGGPEDRRARNTTTIHHHPHGGGGKWQSRVTLDADADSAAAKSTAASRASRSRSAAPGSTTAPEWGGAPGSGGQTQQTAESGVLPITRREGRVPACSARAASRAESAASSAASRSARLAALRRDKAARPSCTLAATSARGSLSSSSRESLYLTPPLPSPLCVMPRA